MDSQNSCDGTGKVASKEQMTPTTHLPRTTQLCPTSGPGIRCKTNLSVPRGLRLGVLHVSSWIFLLSPLGNPASTAFALQNTATVSPNLTTEQTQDLVRRVLRTEQEAAWDTSHPMRYQLRKSSPRLSTTRMIVETRDGDVARLIAVNDSPLSLPEKQAQDQRLQALLHDPGLQKHRQEREQGDAERARKIIRALPDAFLYRFGGIVETPQGSSYRLTFQPNPDFDPHDLEAQALKAMAGEMWIDIAQQRVVRLECKRLHEVDYGWGLFAKLDQGGSLLLEQADVGDHHWRTTHMVLSMNARILLKTINLDTTLELSDFAPVPKGISYQQAIQMLNPESAPWLHPVPAFTPE